MKKAHYIIIGIALLALCAVVLSVTGKTAVSQVPFYGNAPQSIEELNISVDPEEGVISLEEASLKDGVLTLQVRGVGRGRAYVDVMAEDGIGTSKVFYVHRGGIVTADSYFGVCRGGIIVPVAALLYLLLLFFGAYRKYRSGLRQSLYQYRNVLYLGLLISWDSGSCSP